MPRAKLTLTIPEGVWIGDISRSHASASFRILAALPGEDGGVGLAEITAPDLQETLRDMRDREEVGECNVLQRRDDSAIVQFSTSMPFLLFPVQGSGVPLELPFVIQDGQATWEVTAPQRALSELGDQLQAFDIPFTVEWIRQLVDAERLLTDRQLQLVSDAVEYGYYDTPRSCSLTELADAVGIAKSTCSETLHRAEEKIVKQFVEAQDDRPAPSIE